MFLFSSTSIRFCFVFSFISQFLFSSRLCKEVPDFFVLVLNFIQDSNAAAHYFRNLLFGPPSDDYSHIRVWPCIQDTLDLITEDSTAKDLVHIRELLTEEVSRAIAAIHAATYILSDDLHI